MKLKEIVKSKWGWVGAVAGLAVGRFFMGWNVGYIFLEEISISLVQGQNAQLWQYLGFVINGIIGFIAGLILQELWRRIK